MASDRKEVFLARVCELGLEDCIPRMKAKGLETFASFGFGTDYNPQMMDPSLLEKQILEPMSDSKPELYPALRRLWWESWSVATSDMRRHIEASDTDTPRKLGPVELEARRTSVTKTISGLKFEGELDVSDGLISLFVAMHDRNRLHYAGWETCTKREMETLGQRTDDTWSKDPKTGYMKAVSESQPHKKADLSSDLLLDYTLKRRGLAMAKSLKASCMKASLREVAGSQWEEP